LNSDAKLLIVDDDPAALQALHGALEGMGEVVFATDGTEALALVARQSVDLVLLDAQMPSMDGFTTCRALQQDHPDIPIIFVTVASEPGNEIRALEAGASDFISKPINPPLVRARVAVHLKLKAQNDLLRTLSSRDPLTGVANRHALDEQLAREWLRAARLHQPLSLLMINIDQFKTFNHRYGHIKGDDCLRRVAQCLAATVSRAGDLVARHGGAKFAVLLADTPVSAAAAVGEKIRAAMDELAIPHALSGHKSQVTLSIGVASAQPSPQDQGPESMDHDQPAGRESGLHLAKELFERTERALYAAKMAGGDRVCANDAD
jgi:diguanylate cyclase (GGDEF)-like protein